MKNPNGYGSISKLSGKRRKPWIVRVTVGFDEKTGKQIQKTVGTFKERKEALDCLAVYNLSKENKELVNELYHEEAQNMAKKAKICHTFGECVEACIEKDKDKRSKSWFAHRKTHAKLLNGLMNKNIDEINLFEMQEIFDKLKEEGRCKSSLNNCKIICTDAFKYAIIHQWIDRNKDFSQYIDISSDVERKLVHKPFSIDEIKLLRKDGSLNAKIILVYIYTGCRASELLNVEKHDEYIICGIKTKAGKNRKIPIHSFIKPFIDEVLMYLNGKKYDWLQKRIFQYMKEINMTHTMHDTRNTFATLGKEYGMRPTAIKKIMGHKINDLTDDVYTHESIEYLKKEIEKIPSEF